MKYELSTNLKKLNRSLLRKRLLELNNNPKLAQDPIREEDLFNLNMALKACDTFEELYEFIKIL